MAVSSRGLLVSASVSKLPSSREDTSLWITAHPDPVGPGRHLIVSLETLFPNKVTPEVLGVVHLEHTWLPGRGGAAVADSAPPAVGRPVPQVQWWEGLAFLSLVEARNNFWC